MEVVAIEAFVRRVYVAIQNLIGWFKAYRCGITKSRVEVVGGFKIRVYETKRCDQYGVYGTTVILGESFKPYWRAKLLPAALAEACFNANAPLRVLWNGEKRREVIKAIANIYRSPNDRIFVTGEWKSMCKRYARDS